jgi:hypothetical protein
MKVWSGSAWAEKPTKVWSGTAWAVKPVKVWNGTAWITYPAAPAGITAPVFRAGASYNYPGSGGMIYLTKPAGTVAGDILIATIVHAKSAPAQNDLVPNAADGWAKVGTSTVVNGTLSAKLEVWWKRAGASEPASYAFDVWGSSSNEGYIAAYSGCVASGSPIDAFSTNSATTGSTATGTGITTTQANDKLLWIGHNWTASGTLVPPTGMTERREYLLYVADQTIAAAGATGNRTQALAANAPWATYMIALKGDGEAGGGLWTPHEIEDAMWGWWDASIASSLTWSGINLLEIADQGPNNIHMGRAASSGPTATTLNGLGALAFTYDQGLMSSVATTFNDFTIHAVFNPGFSDGNTYERIVDHAYATGWWFGRTGGTQTFGGGIQEGPEVGYGIFVPLVNNEVHQISNVREGGMHRISGNGGAVVNSRAIHTNPTTSNRVYMAQDNVGTSDVTDGEHGEVIIWKRALTSGEMAKTEGYLAHKWGIAAKLPAAHPYKAAPPLLVEPPATAPTDWLTVTYAPGAARDDFTGELGVRILINETRTFTWIGKPNGGGNTGLHRVRVYEWFGDTVVAEGMVDMTGCPLGEMAWVQVPAFTLLAAGYYAILYNATASTGQNWSNQGTVTMKPFIGNIYDVYRVPGGAMYASGANLSYVGVDIGWS